MAIFPSGGGKSSKKTGTPRGSGESFGAGPSIPSTTQAVNYSPSATAAFAPEKTGPSPPPNLASMDSKPSAGRSSSKGCLLDQKPESMVAESLRMKGELEFTRLLRVDGRFEGDLITDKGSLVVGPKGEVVGDLKNMQEVYIEGIVRGSVFANDVKVKNNGMLFGDIQCLCLTLDPTASIKGVADTATLKERAMLEATPPPSSAGSSMSAAISEASGKPPARPNSPPSTSAASGAIGRTPAVTSVGADSARKMSGSSRNEDALPSTYSPSS